jgi:hypothetical protein
MDIQITFRDGPIEAEVSAAEDEPYTEVLDSLAEFVEEYDPVDLNDSEELSEDVAEGTTDGEESTGREAADSGTSKSNSLFEQVDASDSELQRVLKTGRVEDGDIKDFPEIIGNTNLLGDSIGERLLSGAIVTLTVLEEAHDVGRIKTTELKQGLGESGLDIDNWTAIHQPAEKDVYLDSRGAGPSGTTAVRAPGKEDAYDYIQALVNDLREDGDTDE